MTSRDPISDCVRKAKQQLINEIVAKYDHAIWQFDKLLVHEKFCLDLRIDWMNVHMAFMFSGITAKRADGDLSKMSKEEVKLLLKRRINKHEKAIAWLKARKIRMISMAVNKMKA